MCGRVVWLKNPGHKSKSGKLDLRHADSRRPAAAAGNTWEAGWIYNPEDEERFSAAMKLKNDNTLLVTGYLGIKLLGETFIWKRATGPLRALRTRHSADLARPRWFALASTAGASFHRHAFGNPCGLLGLCGQPSALDPAHEPLGALGHDVALLVQRDHVVAVVQHQRVHQPAQMRLQVLGVLQARHVVVARMHDERGLAHLPEVAVSPRRTSALKLANERIGVLKTPAWPASPLCMLETTRARTRSSLRP